jgi:selenocysteine-specific elongation factor
MKRNMIHRHFILGTAGHIDHGKTALVKALTGVDTDRLPEEKARGLTIDLGFAHYGDNVTIIDVPGHEKFVKNMVAGVSTIDLVLFVIAADDGIMPQSREHLEILELLQVRRGIIVLTKKDVVDDEWLSLLGDEVRQFALGTFLEKSPIVPVSSLTGDGIDELKKTIGAFLDELPPRPDRGVFWLPVDRAFTMKGFGTVVTGSVLSGEAAVGDELEILPLRKVARIRGLQRHGKAVGSVRIGDRAAINLQGISTEEVARGQVLALPGYFAPSLRLNCRMRLLASAPGPLRERTRVRVHLGTAEVLARLVPLAEKEIAPGKEGYVQLILEKAAAARRLDAFVVRSYSPARTIGGGVVLEAPAESLERRERAALLERLRGLEREDPAELLVAQLLQPGRYVVTLDQIAAGSGARKEDVQQLISSLQENGIVLTVGKRGFVHKLRIDSLQSHLERLLEGFHQANPMAPGLRKAELPGLLQPLRDAALLNFMIELMKSRRLIKEQDAMIALAGHEIRLTPQQEELRKRVDEQLYAEAFSTSNPAELAGKLNVSQKEIDEIMSLLFASREVIRLEEGIFVHSRRLREAREKVIALLRAQKQMTVSQFKDLLGNTSRKFAVPILEYFDGEGVTERRGDVRVLGVEIE